MLYHDNPEYTKITNDIAKNMLKVMLAGVIAISALHFTTKKVSSSDQNEITVNIDEQNYSYDVIKDVYVPPVETVDQEVLAEYLTSNVVKDIATCSQNAQTIAKASIFRYLDEKQDTKYQKAVDLYTIDSLALGIIYAATTNIKQETAHNKQTLLNAKPSTGLAAVGDVNCSTIKNQ